MSQAIILAAGRGSRLGQATSDRPKCLLPFGSETLLDHQLLSLAEIGIHDVCVVVGYQRDRVQAHCNSSVEYIVNPNYECTNSLFSLWLAKNWVRDDFFLLNGDVLAPPEVLKRLHAHGSTALAYDSSSGDDPEHMKVKTSAHGLRAISKQLDQKDTCGENLGMLYFDAASASRLFELAGELVEAGRLGGWAPEAVGKLAVETRVDCLDMADLSWTEIDFPEDLVDARERVWPTVRSAQAVAV